LAHLTFRAQFSSGSTNLAFSTVDFTDVDLNPVPVVAADGEVAIVNGCCMGQVGDANGAGGDSPTIGDVSALIDAKFITGSCDGIIPCIAEADVNQSGGTDPDCGDITIGDISYLVDYLFITGQSLGLPTCF
jgi:hypothetical protein